MACTHPGARRGDQRPRQRDGAAHYETLTRGRTTFVIAHRLATIRDADLILVLENGEIVERGRYEELVPRDRAFARLARAGELVETEAEDEESGNEGFVRAVPRAASG